MEGIKVKVDTRWFGTIDIDDEKIVLVDILNALKDYNI